MSTTILQKWFPTTTAPFVSNAPMYEAANGSLAAALSKAGGFGFIAGGFDFSATSTQTPALEAELKSARSLLNLQDKRDSALPIGVGFITFHGSVSSFAETLTPVLQRHKPMAIWLFAPVPTHPRSNVHGDIIPAVRSVGAGWGLRVFVQVGSVAAAREAVGQGADGIVAQGVDAGGHQWAKGASIVSIVPEVRAMLRAEFGGREVALLAAGGIVDGKGLAAALALGADGITMGTRFVVSDESPASEHSKSTIIATTDGGTSTVKSTVHDDIQGTGFWPDLYDGRAVVGNPYNDYLSGSSMDEVISQYKAALSARDRSPSIVWAGSGLGLITKKLPAEDIVKSTQQEARNIFRQLADMSRV